jgi:hypothetical protein
LSERLTVKGSEPQVRVCSSRCIAGGEGNMRVCGSHPFTFNWMGSLGDTGHPGDAARLAGSRQQAGDDLAAVAPVDAEVGIGGDHHRVGQGLAQAHQAGVGQAHGHAGVLGAQVEHLE